MEIQRIREQDVLSSPCTPARVPLCPILPALSSTSSCSTPQKTPSRFTASPPNIARRRSPLVSSLLHSPARPGRTARMRGIFEVAAELSGVKISSPPNIRTVCVIEDDENPRGRATSPKRRLETPSSNDGDVDESEGPSRSPSPAKKVKPIVKPALPLRPRRRAVPLSSNSKKENVAARSSGMDADSDGHDSGIEIDGQEARTMARTTSCKAGERQSDADSTDHSRRGRWTRSSSRALDPTQAPWLPSASVTKASVLQEPPTFSRRSSVESWTDDEIFFPAHMRAGGAPTDAFSSQRPWHESSEYDTASSRAESVVLAAPDIASMQTPSNKSPVHEDPAALPVFALPAAVNTTPRRRGPSRFQTPESVHGMTTRRRAQGRGV